MNFKAASSQDRKLNTLLFSMFYTQKKTTPLQYSIGVVFYLNQQASELSSFISLQEKNKEEEALKY